MLRKLLTFTTAFALVFVCSISVSAIPWPKSRGVYIANSSAGIPQFPRSVSGYRSQKGEDFWGNPFDTHGTIRLSEGWSEISEFPNTMNHCSEGLFMIRWRSLNSLKVQTALGFDTDTLSSGRRSGSYGYIYGTNCEEPLFQIQKARGQSSGLIVDITYEIKFWQAAP